MRNRKKSKKRSRSSSSTTKKASGKQIINQAKKLTQSEKDEILKLLKNKEQ